jgi:undecaprenyl-diphosphatase
VTKASEISDGVGWGPTVVARAVSFVVAYASIAWLLRYVAGHNFGVFILYRVILGLVVFGLVATGVTSAT